MEFFIKNSKVIFIIFVFLCLFPIFVYGKEKSTQDISYWYLEQISGLLRVTYSTQLVYPENNSISVVSAEKIFGNNLSIIIESIVDGYKESPKLLPKGLNPKDIETKAWNFLYLSWFMPADKWKLFEQKSDTQFQWNRLGFPIMWDKEPNDEGKINTVIGGWKLYLKKHFMH